MTPIERTSIWPDLNLILDDEALKRLGELAQRAGVDPLETWPSAEAGLGDIGLLWVAAKAETDPDKRTTYIADVDKALRYLCGLLSPVSRPASREPAARLQVRDEDAPIAEQEAEAVAAAAGAIRQLSPRLLQTIGQRVGFDFEELARQLEREIGDISLGILPAEAVRHITGLQHLLDYRVPESSLVVFKRAINAFHRLAWGETARFLARFGFAPAEGSDPFTQVFRLVSDPQKKFHIVLRGSGGKAEEGSWGWGDRYEAIEARQVEGPTVGYEELAAAHRAATGQPEVFPRFASVKRLELVSYDDSSNGDRLGPMPSTGRTVLFAFEISQDSGAGKSEEEPPGEWEGAVETTPVNKAPGLWMPEEGNDVWNALAAAYDVLAPTEFDQQQGGVAATLGRLKELLEKLTIRHEGLTAREKEMMEEALFTAKIFFGARNSNRAARIMTTAWSTLGASIGDGSLTHPTEDEEPLEDPLEAEAIGGEIQAGGPVDGAVSEEQRKLLGLFFDKLTDAVGVRLASEDYRTLNLLRQAERGEALSKAEAMKAFWQVKRIADQNSPSLSQNLTRTIMDLLWEIILPIDPSPRLTFVVVDFGGVFDTPGEAFLFLTLLQESPLVKGFLTFGQFPHGFVDTLQQYPYDKFAGDLSPFKYASVERLIFAPTQAQAEAFNRLGLNPASYNIILLDDRADELAKRFRLSKYLRGIRCIKVDWDTKTARSNVGALWGEISRRLYRAHAHPLALHAIDRIGLVPAGWGDVKNIVAPRPADSLRNTPLWLDRTRGRLYQMEGGQDQQGSFVRIVRYLPELRPIEEEDIRESLLNYLPALPADRIELMHLAPGSSEQNSALAVEGPDGKITVTIENSGMAQTEAFRIVRIVMTGLGFDGSEAAPWAPTFFIGEGEDARFFHAFLNDGVLSLKPESDEPEPDETLTVEEVGAMVERAPSDALSPHIRQIRFMVGDEVRFELPVSDSGGGADNPSRPSPGLRGENQSGGPVTPTPQRVDVPSDKTPAPRDSEKGMLVEHPQARADRIMAKVRQGSVKLEDDGSLALALKQKRDVGAQFIAPEEDAANNNDYYGNSPPPPLKLRGGDGGSYVVDDDVIPEEAANNEDYYVESEEEETGETLESTELQDEAPSSVLLPQTGSLWGAGPALGVGSVLLDAGSAAFVGRPAANLAVLRGILK